MSARSILLATAFILTAAFSAYAQREAEPPAVENSKYQFAAAINANAVNIRSGPGDNYYVTSRLPKGSQVTVVGYKFDWLKISPPDGSFSIIAKQFIQRPEGSTTGVVIADGARVRAGSSVVNVISTVQCRLNKGDQVIILGEQDQYYQIKPPAGAFLYVHQKYVDPVRRLDAGDVARGPTTRPADGTGPATRPTEIVDTEPDGNNSAVSPTTRPTAAQIRESHRRAVAAAEAEFDRLNTQFRSLSEKDLAEQPIPELLAGFEKLLANEYLPVSMRQLAEIRTAVLRIKNEARDELLASRRQQAEMDAKLAAIREKRQEIEQKLSGMIETYAALGTLQATVVQGNQAEANKGIYRLTDPGTGRTLCYVRNNEPDFVKLIGRFIGVKGEVKDDPQLGLKIVDVTATAAIDPAKVNKTVTAQLIPPSLLAGKIETPAKGGQTASTDSGEPK